MRALVILTAFCAGGATMWAFGRGVPKAPSPASAATQWLEGDEYLVLDQPYQAGSGWQYAYVAKMVRPASAATQNQAEFVGVSGGRRGRHIWSGSFHKTRPATAGDMRLGQVAFALDSYTDAEGAYRGPRARDEIEEAAWFVGTLDDVSARYRNEAMLSGYRVRPEGLLVPE